MYRLSRGVIFTLAAVVAYAVLPSFSWGASVIASCPTDPIGDYGSRLVLTIRDCTGTLETESCTSGNPSIESYSERCLDTEVDHSITVTGFGSTEG